MFTSRWYPLAFFGGLLIAATLLASGSSSDEDAAVHAALALAPSKRFWQVRPTNLMPPMDPPPRWFRVDFQPTQTAPRLKVYQTTDCWPGDKDASWSCSPLTDLWIVTPKVTTCPGEVTLHRDSVSDRKLLQVLDFVQSSERLRRQLAQTECSAGSLCKVLSVSGRSPGQLRVALGSSVGCSLDLTLLETCSGARCTYSLTACQEICA